MSRYSDVQSVADALFLQRGEEVLARETVSELSTKKKASKPRLIVLSRTIGSSGGGGATLSIVSIDEDGRHAKIKSAFAVDRMVDISNEGSFDATFNCGASGMLSVSFESHIQREMFVSATRRAQSSLSSGARQGGSGMADGGLGAIRGVLSEAVGAEVEADAAARVRKLRQDKRRVFTVEEELHLLRHMGNGGAGFDDIRQFQAVLLRQQKEAELRSIDLLTSSEACWKRAQQQVQDLIKDVEDVEQRIEEYSTNLLSKKNVIQQVEHENNTLQRKQQNLEQLYIMMSDLRDQLSLAPATVQLLERLRKEPETGLVNFFSDGNNALTLSVAMRHMQSVLHNPKLDADFPITAVSERKLFFVEQRRMITQRSKSYIVSIISTYEEKYLLDRSRYSRGASLVWKLHTDLSCKLLNISDIVCALARIDVEGFQNTLRRYRASMQKVYALEISRFLKSLRMQVRKVNTWKGPFLLGTSSSRSEAISTHMETTQAGETPRLFRGPSVSTPGLTPRMMRGEDDFDGSRGPAGGGPLALNTSGDDHTRLSIEFPGVADLKVVGNIPASSVELYHDPNTLHRLDARAASSSVTNTLKSMAPTSTGGGYVRPDLAFAIALQSVVLAILYEESILLRCFGLTPADAKYGIVAETEVPEAKESPARSDAGTTPSSPRVVLEEERGQMLQDSLLELFGGDDTTHLLQVFQGGPIAPKRSSSRASSRDVGLPPRHPGRSSSTSGYGRDGAVSGVVSGFPHRRSGSNLSSLHSNSGGDSEDDKSFSADGEEARSGYRGGYLARSMRQLASFFVEKCDRIYCIPVLCMIRAYAATSEQTTMLPAKSAFCQALLGDLEKIMAGGVMRFVAEQTESIQQCRKKFTVRPTGLLNCFAKMPPFFLRLEAIHNALADGVCDRTEYASIAVSLVDQSFDALDLVTNMKSGEEKNETALKLNELISRKVSHILDGAPSDMGSLKWVFVQQYRHQSFFCAFYSTMPSNSFAVELLQDHYATAKVKRDRFEELYLTRVLLVRRFPSFGSFVLSAESLALVYSQEDLRHHRSLAPEAVKQVIKGLEKELGSGISASAQRMKKHFLRDVDLLGGEASFHKTLLQRTWQHFSTLLLQKFDFLTKLLSWPLYRDMSMPLSRADVTRMLAEY